MVQLSKPGYIEAMLHKFQHPTSRQPQHSPHTYDQPNYGAKIQLTDPEDTTPLLDKNGIQFLQQVVGTLLYYARAVDSTMLVALGSLAAAQSKGTEATRDALVHLLNYCATHPDATLEFRASDMCLWIHSDTSY